MPAHELTAVHRLTGQELKVLEHLARTLRPGFCPSREELSQAAGLGKRGHHITKVLRDLEARGYLELGAGRSRSIVMRRRADGRPFSLETLWVPLLGQIAAGQPRSTARQDRATGDAIELARSLLGGEEDVFALRVAGDSMVDALVNDGDIVVLAATHDARDGDMVAARVTGADGRPATTLKYFYRDHDHVRLQPAHPDMPPLWYPASRVAIEGKVLLVIRQLT